MKICFISTITGPFTADILTKIANVTRQAGAEWLTTKVVRIDQQFCAMVKTLIATEQMTALKTALEGAFPELTFVHTDIIRQHTQPNKVKTLVLDCSDRPGLTREINQALTELDIHIEQQESHRLMVASMGENVYRAEFIIQLPDTVFTTDITTQLENIDKDIRVEIY